MRTMLILLFLLTACNNQKRTDVKRKQDTELIELAFKAGFIQGQLNCRVGSLTPMTAYKRDSVEFINRLLSRP